jgi:hypothetical protein
MAVDLTKSSSAGPTDGDRQDAPRPVSAVREVLDLLQPRAFVRGWMGGTWILARALGRAVQAGFALVASRTRPAPSGTSRPGGEVDDGQEAKRRSVGDLVEQAGLALLLACVALGALSGIVGWLALLLRPYAGIVSAVLVLAWIVAALTADVVARPANDHEESSGEQGEEAPATAGESSEEDRWDAARKTLVRLVEERASAITEGHVEGIKGRGVPVDDVLAELQQMGSLRGMERKGFVELLKRAGITVRDQMSFKVLEETPEGPKWKKKTPPGIHVDDLAQDLGRTPVLPPHLVPDLTPGAPPIVGAESGPVVGLIPAARTAGE